MSVNVITETAKRTGMIHNRRLMMYLLIFLGPVFGSR
jgi:hypothetical protein